MAITIGGINKKQSRGQFKLRMRLTNDSSKNASKDNFVQNVTLIPTRNDDGIASVALAVARLSTRACPIT